MVDAVPADVPEEAAEAARDTLGGALGVAEGLSAESGAALLGAGREAFVAGLHVVGAACALIALGAALIAVLILRRAPSTEGLDEARDG